MGMQGNDIQSNSFSDEDPSTSTAKKQKTHMSRFGNKSSNKHMRKVAVGWIHAGKQIRTPRGGGTRKLNLPKSYKKGEILEEVKPLREGKSPMGTIEDFDFSVADFLQRDIDGKSINDLYVESKMTTLRLYLMTWKKQRNGGDSEVDDPNSSGGEELPDPQFTDVYVEVVPEIVTVSSENPLNISGNCMGPSNTQNHTTEDNLAATTLESTLSLTNAFSEEVVSLTNVPADSVLLDIQN